MATFPRPLCELKVLWFERASRAVPAADNTPESGASPGPCFAPQAEPFSRLTTSGEAAKGQQDDS